MNRPEKVAFEAMETLLTRILGMHKSDNCGLYNGEAILSESVASEIEYTLKKAKEAK